MTAALVRRPYERGQGKACGYRNGHRGRQVSCGAGNIEIPVPQGLGLGVDYDWDYVNKDTISVATCE